MQSPPTSYICRNDKLPGKLNGHELQGAYALFYHPIRFFPYITHMRLYARSFLKANNENMGRGWRTRLQYYIPYIPIALPCPNPAVDIRAFSCTFHCHVVGSKCGRV